MYAPLVEFWSFLSVADILLLLSPVGHTHPIQIRE